MEVRAIHSEEPAVGDKITTAGDFVVLTEANRKVPSIHWLRRLAQGLLFALFLASLSGVSLLLLGLS